MLQKMSPGFAPDLRLFVCIIAYFCHICTAMPKHMVDNRSRVGLPPQLLLQNQNAPQSSAEMYRTAYSTTTGSGGGVVLYTRAPQSFLLASKQVFLFMSKNGVRV